MSVLGQLKTLSLARILLLSMVIVAMLPIFVLGVHLYNSAWQNSWREIQEKHQLLAQNLAMPISTYINNHHGMLDILAETIPMVGMDKQHVEPLLYKSLFSLDGFRSLILMDMHGNAISHVSTGTIFTQDNVKVMANDRCYLQVRETGKWTLSRVIPHPISGKPTLFMGEVVRNSFNIPIGVILVELKIEYIERIRKQVRFGKKGHSAIVDQTGHVVAHPNPKWMAEIRDLSSWPITREMMAGKTGVTSFYSPFMKGNMVAGYASVADIGWGIMVPQPESEVAEQVNTLMRSHFIWGALGLVMAIVLALLITRWVNAPLHMLAMAGRSLMQKNLEGNLPAVKKNTPKEVSQLADVLRSLISSLQSSRKEVESFNESLQQRVEAATRQLREANMQLEEAAQSDYLTEIANRRYFESCLQQVLSRPNNDKETFCIMLIDIDHFKQINDTYGHAAGDMVLNTVARILEHGMRSGDLVARYGGDEFVAYMRCGREIGVQRAEQIHAAIDQKLVSWNGNRIHITASVGMYCRPYGMALSIEDVLHFADEAMYVAKRQGRNRVIDIAS